MLTSAREVGGGLVGPCGVGGREGVRRLRSLAQRGEAAGEQRVEFTNQPLGWRKGWIRDAAEVTKTVKLQKMRFGQSYENKFFAKTI